MGGQSGINPELKDGSGNLASSNNKAILTTKNYFVDEINDALIIKFLGEVTEYLSYDETFNPNDQGQYVDFLNTFTPNGLPPYKLLLKFDAPIILLRNLDPTKGLCNGTRLICKSFAKNVIHAIISVGDFAGKPIFIHRIHLQPSSNEQHPVPFK